MNAPRLLASSVGLLATMLLASCGGGSADACGAAACDALGAQCGVVTDACGAAVTCGSCGADAVCSTTNQCVPGTCEPATCRELGAWCGAIEDGCGGTLECGPCGEGETCANNLCTGGACEPLTCEASGVECGVAVDGCGGFVECGGCEAGEVCQNNLCVGESSCALGCDLTEECNRETDVCESIFGKPYRIEVGSGTAMTAEADPKYWDDDGTAPDLFVTYGIEGEGGVTTDVAVDTYNPVWGHAAEIVIPDPEGGVFYVDVFERDADGDTWVTGWRWASPRSLAFLLRGGDFDLGGRYSYDRTTEPYDWYGGRVVGPEPDPVIIWGSVTPVE